MPRKGGVRECFHARPGTVWSSVDYAAIEMSTLAQVQLWALGRSTLADAINDGVDPHSLFAAGMTGQPYADFLNLVEAGDKQAKNMRQAAKAANFGFPGMMGGAKFVVAKRREGASVCEWLHHDGACGVERVREWRGRDLDAPLCKRCIEEAEKLRSAYLTQWPEMQPYWAWVQAQMGYAERVEQFVSKRVRGGVSGPAGANTYFQGLAADGAKRALVALTREMYLDRGSPLYGSRLMLMAHDESILEIPEERAHEAATRQAEVMVAAMKTCVPDVKVSAEPALMRVWTKDAKAKYREGRLIPFDDAA
jgi:DNA polymerase I-like protein with 3'-5' exonuclease and polymerase domains